jgi:hypothetical protein
MIGKRRARSGLLIFSLLVAAVLAGAASTGSPNAGSRAATLDASSAATIASPSPVGLWLAGSHLYRWVAIRNGFEERNMTPYKLPHGCLVRKGDAVDRYFRKSKNLYRVAYHYWYRGRGGPGKAGKNCTKRWKAPEATVKIIVTSTRMTVSCDNKPGKVCNRYQQRVSN